MQTFIFAFVITILTSMFIFESYVSVLNYNNRKAKIPEEVSDIYEEEKYNKWLMYTMENFRINKIEGALSFLLLLVFLVIGFFPYLFGLAKDITNNEYLQTLLFFAFFYIITYVTGIYFAYYRKFSIEERYGFNKSTKKTFILDQLKSILLTILFGGGLIYLINILYVKTGAWFYLSSITSIIAIILFTNLFYVKLILPIFNKITPIEDGELKDELIAFAKKAGYEVNKISMINASKRSSKLNAFFSGVGRFKQIVLYDTLIDKMETKEIVAVLGHEIGHAQLKHIRKNIISTILVVLVYIGILMAMLNLKVFSLAFGFEKVNFAFVLIAFSIIISPVSVLIGLLNNRRSRKFEFEADEYTASRGYKEEIEIALKVLTAENFGNLTPHKLYVDLYYSHPTTVDRIRSIRKVDSL